MEADSLEVTNSTFNSCCSQTCKGINYLIGVEDGGFPEEGLECAHAADDVLDFDVTDNCVAMLFPLQITFHS